MAEALSPVASTSITYEETPTTAPPRTEFPYHESRGSGSDTSHRLESDATLADHDVERRDLQNEQLSDPAPDLSTDWSVNRPVLNQRSGTEIQKPVSTRPFLANEKRFSEGWRPSTENPQTFNAATLDSDSDSGFSSDEEPQINLDQQQSRPDHKDLTPAELNRARMRPWHERKRNRLDIGNDNFRTRGKVAKDGRLNIKVSEHANTGYLAKALGHALQGHLHPHARQAKHDAQDLKAQYEDTEQLKRTPRMNIVIMVIGSRGDIQPFLKIGKILQDKHGHRVRIATHPTFRKFVQEDIGLEFFSIGGDPSELMSFMVKNPGLIPSFETLTSGEVGRRREQMYEMFLGFWRACINTTDDEKDTANLKMLGNKHPFIADAIIANPPSFAHYHCAEKLGIPLHLVFTFPYSPTSSFPHPLANIKSSNVDREYTNYMSYPLVDLMTWQGLGDLVNRFRVGTLGLEPVSTLWAPGQITRLRVPMTYLWSPGLVPKPEDWGPEIDIAGYVFLDLAASFKPPADLAKFLERSEKDTRPIVYIGFGSISGLDDPKAFCKLIFEATVKAGVRAIVSKGWGGMGDGMDVPDGVFLVDNVPHDWLFPKLDAVVHHGGAGTTAAGLKFGKPTMIVPFFGDQPFWAAMIGRAGAGAKEVWPLKKLTVERFAKGITDCLEPSAIEAAQSIAKSIELEGDGAENAVNSFHRALPLTGRHSMRCGVFEDRVACWKIKHTGLRLSALAAEILVENKQIAWSDLDLTHHKKWTDFQGPGEPITGAGGVVVAAFQEAFHGLATIPENAKHDFEKIEKYKRKRRVHSVADSDAAVVPGKGAEKVRMDQAAMANDRHKVNLTGEAEPLRLRKPSTKDSTNSGLMDDIRPMNVRTETSTTDPGAVPVVLAKDVGRGMGHSLRAICLLPAEMLNAVTLGFRNAPRLYGDRTVREPPANIHGFRQGMRVAGRELWFGFYDGATGVVRIPYLDTQQDGMRGLPKGMARGMGGLVLKPVAGVLGVVNYPNRGMYASIRRRLRDTGKTERWIRRGRLQQGQSEIKQLREAQQQQQQHSPMRMAQDGGDLEEARSRVLTRWTSQDKRQLEEARQREKTSIAGLPKLSQAFTRSDRHATA